MSSPVDSEGVEKLYSGMLQLQPPGALLGKPLARVEGGAGRRAEQVGITLLLCLGFGKSQKPQLRSLEVKEAGTSN